MFDVFRNCQSFHNIVTAKPALFMPRQIAAFIYLWGNNGDLDSATFILPAKGHGGDEPIMILPLILETCSHSYRDV